MACPMQKLIQMLLFLGNLILIFLEMEEQTEQLKYSNKSDMKKEYRKDFLFDGLSVGIDMKDEHQYPDKVPKKIDNPLKTISNCEVSMKNYTNSQNLSHPVFFLSSLTNQPKEINGISWSFMKKEFYRLQTFKKFPKEMSFSPILLARQGFVYIGNGDRNDDTVLCFFCMNNVKLKDLDAAQRQNNLHNNILNEKCPMVSGQACQNICIEKRNENMFYQIFSLLKSAEQIETRTQPSSHGTGKIVPMEFKRHREVILTSHPRPSLCQQLNLQEQGFEKESTICLGNNKRLQPFGTAEYVVPQIYLASIINSWPVSNTDQEQNMSFLDTEVADAASSNGIHSVQGLASPTERSYSVPSNSQSSSRPHSDEQTNGQEWNWRDVRPNQVRRSAPARFHIHSNTNTDNSATPPPQTLSDVQERPVRPEYAEELTRLHSFEGWPQDHHIEAEDLAKAGYFYTGKDDCVRCFFCGVGLCKWEVGDNMWVEHARWFPRCAFIRQKKGQLFIDSVQQLNM